MIRPVRLLAAAALSGLLAAARRLKGVPSLLVVDPRTDKLLNAGDTANLSDARHMSPQGLADYLARWTG